MRTAAERARLLHERGYDPSEVTEHLREEGRSVTLAEVMAWLAFRPAPEMLTVAGTKMTVQEAARVFGIHHSTLRRRLESGMSPEEALTAPRMSHADSARLAQSPWRTRKSA